MFVPDQYEVNFLGSAIAPKQDSEPGAADAPFIPPDCAATAVSNTLRKPQQVRPGQSLYAQQILLW